VVEGTARITEARLKREVGEGKIIDFRCTEEGYEVIRLEALNAKENKVKHLLTMFGCAAWAYNSLVMLVAVPYSCTLCSALVHNLSTAYLLQLLYKLTTLAIPSLHS